MKYYTLRHSLDINVMGHSPQVKEVIYHCDVRTNPKFIGKFHFEKITVEPIIANPILHPNSVLTDLIYLWNVGFSFMLLMSGKLKKILASNRKNGMQFIHCSVFQNGIEYEDYWLLNMFEINNELIEFSDSNISVEEAQPDVGFVKRKIIGIKSLDQFNELIEKHSEKMEVVSIDNVSLKSNIVSDFFLLKYPIRYVVSENLRNEIETANCTGVEFMPVELSLNEWLAKGGERERVYGEA